jgi:hypothetical protein
MITAAYAAIFVWILAGIMYAGQVVGGLISGGTYALMAAAWLIIVLVAAGVGGRLYSEEGAAVAAGR